MKISLWQKVIISSLLGALFGYLIPEYHVIVQPIAIIYVNLIKMLIVPTIFFAILYGMTNISDISDFERIGIKSIFVYFIATTIAVTIGIFITSYFTPGIKYNLSFDNNIIALSNTVPKFAIQDILINIFPSNPILAMTNGNTIQVACFSFILGFAMILAGDAAIEAKKITISITKVIFKMVEIVIKTTPYGVFSIMMCNVSKYGIYALLNLGKLAAVIMFAFFIQYILFGAMLLIVNLNPIKFYKKTFNIQSIAFATSSSKATISTAINDLINKLGVSKQVAGFILPLGTAINMTGSAIYLSSCTIFFAQVFGVNLSFDQYLILIITATIGSIGAAGYPSGAAIMLSMVLSAVGLPTEGIPLIIGIDRLLDMFRTVVNVTGDCAVTVLIDKTENTLNLNTYND